MILKAVLFDLDDTLHNKSETLRIFAQKQYESVLVSLDIDKDIWINQYIELNNLRIEKTEVFNRLQMQFNLDNKIRNSLLEDFDNNLGKFAQPFPGAVELIRFCKESDLKTAIVTNGRDEFQRSKIIGLGIASMVDLVVTSGGLGIKKPDQRIFQACLDDLDIKPEYTIFVGDDFKADIEPAKKIGMSTIWKSTEKSCMADFCSDSFQEIHNYLFGIEALFFNIKE